MFLDLSTIKYACSMWFEVAYCIVTIENCTRLVRIRVASIDMNKLDGTCSRVIPNTLSSFDVHFFLLWNLHVHIL